MPARIVIAHEYYLLTEALVDLVGQSEDYSVVFTTDSYDQLLARFRQLAAPPEVLVLDFNLIQDFAALQAFCQRYPSLCVLILSVPGHDVFRARLGRCGVHGYLLRDARSDEFRRALHELITRGFYAPRPPARILLSTSPSVTVLNNREHNFLRWACSELTYNEIADQMCVSPRTVDGYREVVFQKMSVRTRVGMVIKAMQHGLVSL